tara:strand:- start:3880 stop:5346 length:1467 start_codon:yes stop_codon:yes gene_type:complete
MAIKRYSAEADNTISNAFQENLRIRATGSNMGQADVSEVYSIYGRQTTSSAELSRVLTSFDINSISSDRTAGIIPASGSVSFYVRLFNAETSKTVPKNFTIVAQAISKSWSEGDGLDLENYKDLGASNWISASKGQPWESQGGDYHTSPKYNQTFKTGLEDLEIDISELVEQWIAGTKQNYGVGFRLTASQEAKSDTNSGGAEESYYTKRFFARGTQYFFKKPVIEARWNSSNQDDRGDFYYSSSLAPASENLNTIYLYNFVRGALTNIPVIGTGNIFVNLYSGSTSPTGNKLVLHDGKTNVTGGHVSTGIYSCSVAITSAATPLRTLFDVWHNDSGTQYFTGTIKPETHLALGASTGNTRYVTSIKNLRSKYFSEEEARFNVYVRNKNWSPTIYTVASKEIENTTIPSASFRVYRIFDGFNAIPHGTGSDLHTLLSYDVSGNYFDLDMSLLEPGYEYGIKLAFYDSQRQSWIEQDQKFMFRVEDYEH